MREIKFRVYSDELKEMIYPDKESKYHFNISSDGDALIYEGYFEHWDFDAVVMQFTGLIDKNGVDIYEGDIVDYGADYSVVHYQDGCFWSRLGQYQLYSHSKDDIEVIGNIYENPDLLTTT